MRYVDHLNEKKTPQSEAIPGSSQVPNSAGGYAFAVDQETHTLSGWYERFVELSKADEDRKRRMARVEELEFEEWAEPGIDFQERSVVEVRS